MATIETGWSRVDAKSVDMMLRTSKIGSKYGINPSARAFLWALAHHGGEMAPGKGETVSKMFVEAMPDPWSFMPQTTRSPLPGTIMRAFEDAQVIDRETTTDPDADTSLKGGPKKKRHPGKILRVELTSLGESWLEHTELLTESERTALLDELDRARAAEVLAELPVEDEVVEALAELEEAGLVEEVEPTLRQYLVATAKPAPDGTLDEIHWTTTWGTDPEDALLRIGQGWPDGTRFLVGPVERQGHTRVQTVFDTEPVATL